MDIDQKLGEAEAALREGDHGAAYSALLPALSYPMGGLDVIGEEGALRRALGLLAELSLAFGAAPLAQAIGRAKEAPNDPEALFEAAYGLYEQQQFTVAATLFSRANRLAPGQIGIVSELAMCLEHLLLYGHAALALDASGAPEEDPICAYLSGFHWLMSGDLEVPKERLAQLRTFEQGQEEGPLPFMRSALAGMVARAEAIRSAGVALDERSLTAWHAALNGSLLLHESPHGYEEAMRGRYAYLGDSPGLMKEGLLRLRALLLALGEEPPKVIAAPGRPSAILARAAAELFGLPLTAWREGPVEEGLVVAWSMESTEDPSFLRALHDHAPGQRLYVHASCWTEPFAYAPEITTVLYQSISHPFTGGALRVDPETNEVGPADPDPRSADELAQAILEAEHAQEDASVSDPALPARIAEALGALPDAQLPEEQRLGVHRAHGKRYHQRAGGPVPSNRFL